MKCITCKKFEAADSWKDKLTSWLIWHIFPKTLKDEKTCSRLEGFAEGYQLSGKQGKELKEIRNQLDRIEECQKK